MAEGYLDPAAYSKGANELLQEKKCLKRQKKDLIHSHTSGAQHVLETGELLHYAQKGEMLLSFDGGLFTHFVERIRVYTRSEVGFEMKCGLTLRERLGDPVATVFRLVEETERLDDPFQQAEYAYSLGRV